jgi:hypothetical protein
MQQIFSTEKISLRCTKFKENIRGVQNILKGRCHEIFDPQTICRNVRDIRLTCSLSRRKRFPRCQRDRRSGLSGLNEIAKVLKSCRYSGSISQNLLFAAFSSKGYIYPPQKQTHYTRIVTGKCSYWGFGG